MEPVEPEFAAIVDWLSRPATHGPQTERVERIETHLSIVFLTDDRAYKLKKRLAFGFVDFRALAAREQACAEEIRLNRRLAPESYLGVSSVTVDDQGQLALGGPGRVVDCVVVMRRLPTDQALDVLIRTGRLKTVQVERLARRLVEFYRELPALAVSTEAYLEHVTAHVRGNRTELLNAAHEMPAELVERIHGTQLTWLALRRRLLEQRVAAGRIVEGHGDLRPEHVCFSPAPLVFDAVEFSAELRQLDVADELSFLSMECDTLGAAWVGQQLLAAWQTASGDRPPPPVLAFYRSYRACVRAKVAVLRADQVDGSARAAARATAIGYLQLADRYLAERAQPLVVVISGLMGCGKSTLAGSLAALLGARRWSTDELRRQLFGRSPTPAAYNTGNYEPSAQTHVYRELLNRAERDLSTGLSVVLDGTFLFEGWRNEAKQLATRQRAAWQWVVCRCAPDVARERIAWRSATGGDASEGRVDLFDQQWAEYGNRPIDPGALVVDGNTAVDEQQRAVLAALRQVWRG